jgi:hypothetical protein
VSRLGGPTIQFMGCLFEYLRQVLAGLGQDRGIPAKLEALGRLVESFMKASDRREAEASRQRWERSVLQGFEAGASRAYRFAKMQGPTALRRCKGRGRMRDDDNIRSGH